MARRRPDRRAAGWSPVRRRPARRGWRDRCRRGAVADRSARPGSSHIGLQILRLQPYFPKIIPVVARTTEGCDTDSMLATGTATIKDSILDAIGDTPLVRLSRLGAGLTPQIVAK